MPVIPSNSVLRYIRKLTEAASTRKLADGELLRRFASQRDQTAFEALVCRHGPMVFRVCLRVLPSEQDAEDAFQATFVVLAKKANSLQRPESIGSWLFGVAYRLARNLKRSTARRRSREGDAAKKPTGDPLAEISVREAQEMLDEELGRLPDKHQAPLVLCCLEGLTRDEAARQLGLPMSTLKSRLEQGRELLRRRLACRGLTLTGALLASVLCGQGTHAALPAALLGSTVKGATHVAAGGAAASVVSARAAALAQGVLKAMFVTKLRIAMVVLFLAGILGVGAGASIVAHWTQAAEPATTEPAAKQNGNRKEGQELRGEKDNAAGVATCLSFAFKGADEATNTLSVRIRGTGMVIDGFRVAPDVKVEGKVLHRGTEQEHQLIGIKKLNGFLHDSGQGMPVTLTLAPDGITVTRIESMWYGLEGVVKSVDAPKRSITLTIRERKWTSEGSLPVAEDAPIWIDGKKSKLQELKPGHDGRHANYSGTAPPTGPGRRDRRHRNHSNLADYRCDRARRGCC